MSLTDEQKALRRTGVGASEAAAVLGRSPYAAPIDVWRAKVEGFDLEETLPMKRGRILEPAVCAWYAEDTGAQLREVGTLRHPSSRVLMATPDRIATLPTDERVLEVKTAHFRMLPQWGEPGTDQVPEAYLVQTAVEMACAGTARADVAVLIAGDDFRIYHLERDLELEAMVVEAVERFHRDYVVTRKPPPPDSSESYGEWLKAKYPSAQDVVMVATPEAEAWAQEYRAARLLREASALREKEARNHLQAIMGEAKVLAGAGWRISYAPQGGKAGVDVAALKSAGLYERYAKQGKPFRSFRPSFAGMELSDE